MASHRDLSDRVAIASDRARLLADVATACRLQGTFLLRSGTTSTTYLDKFQFTSRPDLLRDIAESMVPLLPADTEVLGGLELGGVPIATALSLRTGLPVAFVRKEAKRYGTARLAEGPDIDGRRVTLVEDIVTTGGQVAISANELRALGASVDRAVVVIDRSRGAHAPLDEAGITITSLFEIDELPDA